MLLLRILTCGANAFGVVPNVVEIERFSSGAGHGGTLPRLNFFHEENRNE